MKIFNLQTHIVEYRSYTEFVDFVAVKDYGIRRYCAAMKYRIKYEKIEQCGQKGLAKPG